MRILVTGSGGFIGRVFVRQASQAGHELGLLVRPGSEAPSGYSIFAGDIGSDLGCVMRDFAPEVCVHLAWITTPGMYLESAENISLAQETLTLATKLQAHGLPHFIAAGTCLEYESSAVALTESAPLSRSATPYAAAKMRVHQGLQERFPPSFWSWLRVFYPYGPGDNPARLPGQLRRSRETGVPVQLSRPLDVVDYIHVEDVAAAFLFAAAHKLEGVFNVGSGSPISVGEFASLCAEVGGYPQPIYLPQKETTSRFAGIERLRSLGWAPERKMETSLAEMARS